MDIDPEIQANLIEPFLNASISTLRDMAACDAYPRGITARPSWESRGEITAVLGLKGERPGALVLSMPATTATALTERLLAEAGIPVDDQLIRDSIGEIANVIGGQAKALTHGTPQAFSLETPTILGEARPTRFDDLPCYEIEWGSDLGDFAMYLCKKA